MRRQLDYKYMRYPSFHYNRWTNQIRLYYYVCTDRRKSNFGNSLSLNTPRAAMIQFSFWFLIFSGPHGVVSAVPVYTFCTSLLFMLHPYLYSNLKYPIQYSINVPIWRRSAVGQDLVS